MAQVQFQDDERTYLDPLASPQVTDTRVRVDEPFDLTAEYQRAFGRNPDAGELATEPENIAKYGLGQFRSNLADRAKSNGGGRAPRGIGPLFDDPASNQLQSIAQAQMGEVRSNPGLDDLMGFLTSQFNTLSNSQGFQPDELSMLRTQALEPIEQRRQASNTRALERAGARGFLPTSGLTYLTGAPQGGVETLDTAYDRQRTAADRDLGLANVAQRRADLAQALQIGQLRGLDIPRSQRAEELSLARVPYQMGRDSLSDLLAVLGASPSTTDVFNQSNQTAAQNFQNQQREDQRNAALMEEIGAVLARLFG